MNKLTHKTERYFGSNVNIHTVSWNKDVDIDPKEVRKWCKKNFGKSGYDESTGSNRWLDYTKSNEVVLTHDDDLTLFILRWS